MHTIKKWRLRCGRLKLNLSSFTSEFSASAQKRLFKNKKKAKRTNRNIQLELSLIKDANMNM